MGRLTRDILEEFMGINVFNNIKVLDLSGKALRHCGDVFESEDFSKLQELNMAHNFLSSITPLKLLQNLQKLELQSNSIGDGPLLEDNSSNASSWTHSIDCSTREEAGADECAQTKKQGASLRASMTKLDEQLSFHKLEILQLDGNSISDINSLKLQQSSPNIRLLSLKSNVIAKIDGLNGLIFLQKLYLDHNRIKKVEPCSFEGLPSLEELHLSDNTIKTAKNMEGLSSLKSLNLATNYLMADRLGGLPCIQELACLSRLQDLTLSENPICRQPQYRCAVLSILCQLARLDGEDITEDQRGDAEMYDVEKASEAVAFEQDIFSPAALDPLDDQGLHSATTASHAANWSGKMALKVTPFHFEAMSATYCQAAPVTASVCAPASVHTWELENARSRRQGDVQRLTAPPSKAGTRRPLLPLVLLQSSCRVKEK